MLSLKVEQLLNEFHQKDQCEQLTNLESQEQYWPWNG